MLIIAVIIQLPEHEKSRPRQECEGGCSKDDTSGSLKFPVQSVQAVEPVSQAFSASWFEVQLE